MKEFFAAVGKMLKRNLHLKIAALVFAVLVWLFVMAETNPSRDKVVKNAPVVFQNVEYLTDKGLTTTTTLNDILASVQVTVRAKQRELSYIDGTNVSGIVDFSAVNDAGEVTIAVSATSKYGTVVHVSPSSVTVTVDDLVSREVPVHLVELGEKTAGYYYAEPTLMPSSVTVTGMRDVVASVASAVCALDYTGAVNDISVSLPVTLYDANGTQIDQSLLSALPTCIVSARVYPQREVSVDAASSITGIEALAEGYEIKSVTTDPAVISVAGAAAKLAAVTSAYTDVIDVTGASATIRRNVSLKTESGLIYPERSQVIVEIEIGQIQSEQVFDDVRLETRNLARRLSASLTPGSVNVTAAGNILDLQKLSKDDIIAYVDLAGLTAGVHTVSVKFETVEGLALAADVPQITVEIK